MSESEILLSICVPTYNRQFLLERNISFHLKSFRELGISFEIVVVDDCSTDNTAEYMKSLAHVPEISAFRRASNSGFVSNYAFAMRRAKGRYAVFLGDDDLLIPEKVVEYLRLMEADPDLGMIQAPWLLVDARPGRGDMGPFYRIPGPTRFARGDFRGLLDFILAWHVFPEFLIVRRDVLDKTISGGTPFIFWAYLYTTRALDKAGVMFVPEPFARVTAVSDDPRMQQGNNECMFQWDTYRGGLEYLASQSWKGQQPTPLDYQNTTEKIMDFMYKRQSVALRLHIQTKNWVEAYILYHRMAAYKEITLPGTSVDMLRKLAGVAMAASEATSFNALPAIVDPALTADLINLLPAKVQERLTRNVPMGAEDGGRAWLKLDPRFGEPMRPQDAAFNVSSYVDQFI
ncbi:glycosyltransferase family 2 protein [Neorhizobium sp. NCHU2750]|uniref:glycosyltransferase family 2 protein n=1 Tax=Neorhizobium sp. NCHU2750 TaxID=1825976 RepID=UPI0013C43213